jgi:hypothetical protein
LKNFPDEVEVLYLIPDVIFSHPIIYSSLTLAVGHQNEENIQLYLLDKRKVSLAQTHSIFYITFSVTYSFEGSDFQYLEMKFLRPWSFLVTVVWNVHYLDSRQNYTFSHTQWIIGSVKILFCNLNHHLCQVTV